MKRYEAGENITLEAALYAYENGGIATVVTDGIYIQVEKEENGNETI